MISYDRSVALLRSITTCPASLESTSLVFAYGLDLYYIRLAPAKSFDLLPSDFKYGLLVLLVVGLSVATLVCRHIVKSKKLYDAWN